MRSGTLKQSIIIQEVVHTQNSYGEPNEQWVTFWACQASVEPVMGRKYYANLQDNSEITAEIRIRYKANTSARMRILHGDDIYDIKSVINPHSENKELILMCKKHD